ncbi:plasma kallikrein [Brachionus plicatilis]|uniref:Plasma kallikrein n=1 Tax=Brachionus plicatilis TaxID=10195 RepID=A0A3M7Q9D8_BRAPC|nr:plasma kallikrein [Brachionus plicatilis]
MIPNVSQAVLILFALAIDRQTQCFINPPECGRRIEDIKAERLNKIVGGQQADSEDWGWQVALFIDTTYICGGTLIDTEWVITAAECIDERFSLELYNLLFGLYNRSKPESYSIKRTLTEFVVHPQYNSDNLHNNIALLKLSSPVEYTDQILPICLPSQNYDFSDQMSWATGWGYLEFQGKTSNILMEMQSKILNDSMCEQRYINLNLPKFNSLVNVCAGGNSKSICIADSGGPLVVNVSGKWQLAGISSWTNIQTEDGCDDGGVFVKISFYIDWILSYTQETISYSQTSQISSTETTGNITKNLTINSTMNREFSTEFSSSSEVSPQRTALPNTMKSSQSDSPFETANNFSTGTFSSVTINKIEFSILIKKIIKLTPTGVLRSMIVGDTDLTDLESLLKTLIPLSSYSAYDENGIVFIDATVQAYLNSESEIGSFVSVFFSILNRNEENLKEKTPAGFLMSIEKSSTISGKG